MPQVMLYASLTMEPDPKRVKTSNFTSDDEARDYMQHMLESMRDNPSQPMMNRPDLQRDVWILILSNNPSLSVQDISRMCRVNRDFAALCHSGLIWNRIFQRQFGASAFQHAQQEFPDPLPDPSVGGRNVGKNALLRLMTWRISKWPNAGPGYDTQRLWNYWTLRKKNKLLTYEKRHNVLVANSDGVFVFHYKGRDIRIYENERNFWENTVLKLTTDARTTEVGSLWYFFSKSGAQFDPRMERRVIYTALSRGYHSRGLHHERSENVGNSGFTEIQCALCHTRVAVGTCQQCGLDVCGSRCMLQEWSLNDSVHRKTCGLNFKNWPFGMVEGKRGRDSFESTLPTNLTDNTKYAPKTRREPYSDPYEDVLKPYMRDNDAWLRRFAQMNPDEIKYALQSSPSFHFYFGYNDRFWFWYQQFHGMH